MDDDEDAPMIESDNEIDSDALEAGGYSARGPQADDRASLPSKLETVEQMEVDSSPSRVQFSADSGRTT